MAKIIHWIIRLVFKASHTKVQAERNCFDNKKRRIVGEGHGGRWEGAQCSKWYLNFMNILQLYSNYVEYIFRIFLTKNKKVIPRILRMLHSFYVQETKEVQYATVYPEQLVKPNTRNLYIIHKILHKFTQL